MMLYNNFDYTLMGVVGLCFMGTSYGLYRFCSNYFNYSKNNVNDLDTTSSTSSGDETITPFSYKSLISSFFWQDKGVLTERNETLNKGVLTEVTQTSDKLLGTDNEVIQTLDKSVGTDNEVILNNQKIYSDKEVLTDSLFSDLELNVFDYLSFSA